MWKYIDDNYCNYNHHNNSNNHHNKVSDEILTCYLRFYFYLFNKNESRGSCFFRELAASAINRIMNDG